MKRFIGIVIVATSIGAPAFAQSFDPDNGTGNLVTGNFVAAAPVHARAAPRHPGEKAYALSPRRTIDQCRTVQRHSGRRQHGLQ